MKVITFLIIFSLIGFNNAVAAVSVNNIPSKTLVDEIQIFLNQDQENPILGLDTNINKRLYLLKWAWGLGNKGNPVDNRAYLVTLAIDLYNTIPPGLMPEQRTLEPGEDIYEPNLRPIKIQILSRMAVLNINRTLSFEERKATWEYSKKRFSDERLLPIIEVEYIRQFLRDEIKKGNIIFDEYSAPASLNPEKLDILNPTHYVALKQHMEKMQPAMDAGVPPWEAERYLAANPIATTTTQTTPSAAVVKKQPEPPKPTSQPKAQASDQPIAEAPMYQRFEILIALLVIGLGFVVYLLRRRKR